MDQSPEVRVWMGDRKPVCTSRAGFEMGRTKVKQRRQKPDQDHLTEQWQSEAGWKGERSCCLVGTEFQVCKRHLRTFWRTITQQIEYTWCYRTVDMQMAEKVNFIFLMQFFKLLKKKWKVINFLKEFWWCLRGNKRPLCGFREGTETR